MFSYPTAMAAVVNPKRRTSIIQRAALQALIPKQTLWISSNKVSAIIGVYVARHEMLLGLQRLIRATSDFNTRSSTNSFRFHILSVRFLHLTQRGPVYSISVSPNGRQLGDSEFW